MLRLLATSIAAAAFCAGAALAEPPRTLDSVEVSYGDLDLTSPDGAQHMLMRINKAAWKACKYPPGTLVQRRCIDQTVARAVAELKSPEVATLYARK